MFLKGYTSRALQDLKIESLEDNLQPSNLQPSCNLQWQEYVNGGGLVALGERLRA